MSLKWQGYNLNAFRAWGEVILHTIACVVILLVIIIYFIVTYGTSHKTKNIKEVSNSSTNTNTNTNIPDNTKNTTYKSSKASIDKRFNKFLIGSLILSFIYIYLTYFLNVISVIVLGYRWNHGCFIRLICADIPFGLQRIVAYSFYILRLNVTFKNSTFEVSQTSINIIVILLIISVSITMILVGISGYLAHDFGCDGEYQLFVIISVGLFNLNDIIWSIILSGIYIKKLRQLIRMMGTKQDALVSIVQRLSILAFVTVISTIILFSITLIAVLWAYTLPSIDLIINNICIMLSFAVFHQSYKKCCCFCVKIQSICCITPNKDEMELQKDIQYNATQQQSPRDQP